MTIHYDIKKNDNSRKVLCEHYGTESRLISNMNQKNRTFQLNEKLFTVKCN